MMAEALLKRMRVNRVCLPGHPEYPHDVIYRLYATCEDLDVHWILSNEN